MTSGRSINTARAGETEKSQKHQYYAKENRHHEVSLCPALVTRAAGGLTPRNMSCVVDRS
jgi:hypothetical protein